MVKFKQIMAQYIDKDALVAEIERTQKRLNIDDIGGRSVMAWSECFKNFIDTLEVKDPYEKYIQYASIEDGIKAHAEIYSFNIEGELFNQLTKEQQALWRKEIEQAVISGGYNGLNLARDPRYKENVEVKEVDLQSEIDRVWDNTSNNFLEDGWNEFEDIAKHFFELGLQVSNKAQKGE